MLTDFVKVCTIGEVPEGEMVGVTAMGEDVLLVRVEDTVYAINNLCSHAGAWLELGRLLPTTCEVECPVHEGRFDLRTGAATRGPAEEPVRAYAVRVEGDDVLVGPAPSA
jgi:nitrite reductase/ring-hydroxylating ferredoxin subunit